jgi:hypothetical protein
MLECADQVLEALSPLSMRETPRVVPLGVGATDAARIDVRLEPPAMLARLPR